ncbi:MAG: aminotransferase class IV [Clostridia bacterium]
MENLGYYNEEIDELQTLKIPVLDRACYFGDAIYDATYSNNHNPFALREHIDRFFESSKLVGINLDFSKDFLEDLIRNLAKKVDNGNQFVYWQASRGSAIREHYYKGKANLLVMIYPKDIVAMDTKYKVITLEDKRYLYCNAKTINLMPNILGSINAKKVGCNEAIFIRNGIVSEGLHSNVHILKDNKLITPILDNRILSGVARNHLLLACEKLGIPVQSRDIAENELYDCDQIIFTSSGGMCVGVKQINETKIIQNNQSTLNKLKEIIYKEFFDSTKYGL